VLALTAITAGAFAYTEHLKLQRSPVTSPQLTRFFSPVCGCPTRAAEIGFRLRRAERIDVSIVDRQGNPVRVLATRRSHRAGLVRLRWDGRTDSGARAADGVYRVSVRLDNARRTIVIPVNVNLDTKPPLVRLGRVAPTTFSPDGDGRKDRSVIRYTSSETGTPLIDVDGKTSQGHVHAAGASRIRWGGAVGGSLLPQGTYDVGLRVRDRAGNVSAPTRPVQITVRYIALAGGPFRVRRGGRLQARVETDAASFAWSLRVRLGGRPLAAGRGAGSGALAVRVPLRVKPGRYLLVVSERGHDATAPVVVTRR